jgi:hypothetical protein
LRDLAPPRNDEKGPENNKRGEFASPLVDYLPLASEELGRELLAAQALVVALDGRGELALPSAVGFS